MTESRNGGAWPAVTFEQLSWRPDGSAMSRNEKRRQQGMYSAAVLKPIAPQRNLGLDAETLAAVDDASQAATRFDADFGADILPFSSILLRTESAASSQIENLTASARTIARTELGYQRGTNGQIIVANVRAMETAIELARRIDATSIIEMHRALLESSQPETVGRFRDQQNWIGGSDYGPRGALFVPPHERHVAAAMNDLIAFIDRDDIPVLAHAALAHAQFETIHPFPDGNGRTGRALVHAMAVGKGLVRNVTVPVSAGILANVNAYFAALTRYREGSTNEIVALVAGAVLRSVANGENLVSDLRRQRAEWQDTISARSDAALWRVLDLVFRYPVLNSSVVETELGVTAKTALDAIDRLVVEGALKQIGNARRNRTWEAPFVLAELDAFAQRAGRRVQQ